MNKGTTLPINVGDKIENERGIDGTLIPVGAKVRYSTGVDQKTGDYDVVMSSKGKKMLGYPNCPLWEGWNGPMTILSLPEN